MQSNNTESLHLSGRNTPNFSSGQHQLNMNHINLWEEIILTVPLLIMGIPLCAL